MAKRPNRTPVDPVLGELTSIKRLLVCALLRSGTSQEEIGKALGVTQGTVSKMLSNGVDNKPKRANARSK